MEKWYVRVPTAGISTEVQKELLRKGYIWIDGSTEICDFPINKHGARGAICVSNGRFSGATFEYYEGERIPEATINAVFSDMVPDIKKDLPEELPPIKTADALKAMEECADVNRTFKILWPEIF